MAERRSDGRARRRRCGSVLIGLAMVLALSGCRVLAHETTSASGSPFNPATLSCSQLQAQGGELLSAAASQLAESISGPTDAQTVASRLQTILIAGCRQVKGSFHPGQAALKQYHEEYP